MSGTGERDDGVEGVGPLVGGGSRRASRWERLGPVGAAVGAAEVW